MSPSHGSERGLDIILNVRTSERKYQLEQSVKMGTIQIRPMNSEACEVVVYVTIKSGPK